MSLSGSSQVRAISKYRRAARRRPAVAAARARTLRAIRARLCGPDRPSARGRLKLLVQRGLGKVGGAALGGSSTRSSWPNSCVASRRRAVTSPFSKPILGYMLPRERRLGTGAHEVWGYPTSVQCRSGRWGEVLELLGQLASWPCASSWRARSRLTPSSRPSEANEAESSLRMRFSTMSRSRSSSTERAPARRSLDSALAALSPNDHVLRLVGAREHLDQSRVGVVVGRGVERDLALVEAAQELGHLLLGGVELGGELRDQLFMDRR